MTAVLGRASLRGEAARDLVAVWLTITAVLTYLDVPLRHSPLFAANIVLQASLGMLVITRLLRGVAPSLLLLCGPGLILGGALSFAIFQIVGRGTLGVVITLAVGVSAKLVLLTSQEPHEIVAPRWWLLGQLLGMAMLAITTEFTELLPLTAMLLTTGIILSPSKSRDMRTRWATIGLAATVAISFVFLRDDNWWVITDDYQFLEVLTRHVTVSGPNAAWGVESFARYHWLSYGWAGILDLLGGGPEPLVTLTRVMPIVYSIALAASVALIAHIFLHGQTKATVFIGAWSVIAVGNFEWTGTSTGGVFSVLASFVAVGVLVSKVQPSVSRSLFLLLAFAGITSLTKAPALLGITLATMTVASGLIGRRFRSHSKCLVVTALGLVVSLSLCVIVVWLFGRVTDDRIQLALKSYSLGQLSEFGASFSAPTLIFKRLFIWFPISYCLIMTLGRFRKSTFSAQWAAMSLGALAIGGLFVEVFVQGRANTSEYLSEPLYFLASLSLIQFGSFTTKRFTTVPTDFTEKYLLILLLSLGLLWGSTSIREVFWDAITALVSDGPSLKVELLKFASADSRLGAVVVAITVLGATNLRRKVTRLLLITLVILSVGNLAQPAIFDFRHDLSAARKDLIMGSDSVRSTGVWLNTFTGKSDLIATNHRADSDRSGEVDFALAVWARREFLSLGRQLSTTDVSDARLQATLISDDFANLPNATNCKSMRDYGIGWFVVDLRLTDNRDWSVCAEEVFSAGEFIVLAIRTDV